MGKAIRASVLVLVLCSVTHAGYIPNDVPAPPPSAQPVTTTELETTTENETQDSTSGTVAQVALDLLSVLPSLL